MLQSDPGDAGPTHLGQLVGRTRDAPNTPSQRVRSLALFAETAPLASTGTALARADEPGAPARALLRLSEKQTGVDDGRPPYAPDIGG